MFRKTVLGLGAALILTAAVAPTAAFAGHHGGGHHGKHHGKHHGGYGNWHGGPGIYVGGGYGYGYGDESCIVKKVKVWNKYEGGFYWKKKVVCY